MSNPLFQPASEWPVRGEYDVVVIGAGPGGIGAGVAAARLGLKTLVIERQGFAGGVGTGACCPHLMGFARDGRQIAGGVADDLVREMDAMGQARFIVDPVHGPDDKPIGPRPLTTNVIFGIEGMRVAANRLFDRAGTERLYYTRLLGAVVEDGRVAAVAIDNAEGPGLVKARTFVDATGDADLVWRAGALVREAPADAAMTKTILFRVGGVHERHRTPSAEFYSRLFEAGRAPFPNQDRLMMVGMLNPGEVLLNFTLAIGDALSAADMSRMDAELREQVVLAVDWFRREMPAFADCYLVDTAVYVGVRAGRGIEGLETITTDDLDGGTPVAEPVALGHRHYGGHGLRSFTDGWQKHNPGSRGIPRGCLIPKDLGNVAAGGRSISADARTLTSFRLMAQCLTIGQAAGVMAGLAARDGATIPDVAYPEIREALLDQGAILE